MIAKVYSGKTTIFTHLTGDLVVPTAILDAVFKKEILNFVGNQTRIYLLPKPVAETLHTLSYYC
jgi:hypothetical protein